MKHYMRLHPEPFEQIFTRSKTAEARLNDKKRSVIRPGDKIVFLKRPDEKESLTVEVTNKILFDSFDTMSKNFDLEKLGFKKESTTQDCIDCYRQYYKEYDEKDYGVVVLEFTKK